MARQQKEGKATRNRRRRTTTPEARENQLISLAVDLAEQQLREGTASAQVISHYLKLATTREQLERKKLERENRLLDAKVEAYASSKRIEELYAQALTAMRSYAGQVEYEDEYDDYE